MKNIIIQEGGNNKQMTATKLKTTQVGGGSVMWVPEDEVQLMTKSISENGTYEAEDEGKYGYSVVTVNVPGGSGSADSDGKPSGGTTTPGGPGSAVVGKDGDGNEVVVGVDDNHNLVSTLIPSSIEITVEPEKLTYTEGEAISLHRITVIAKKADGTVCMYDETRPNGDIPVNELSPDPATAIIDDGKGTATSALVNNIDIPTFTGTLNGTKIKTSGSCTTGYENLPGIVGAVTSSDGNNLYIVFASATPVENHPVDVYWNNGSMPLTSYYSLNNTYTFDGKTVYYGYKDLPDRTWVDWDQDFVALPQQISIGAVAWTLLYGEITGEGRQEITVNWPRYGDGKILSDTYVITVNPSSSSESGGTFDTEGGGEHTSSSGGF